MQMNSRISQFQIKYYSYNCTNRVIIRLVSCGLNQNVSSLKRNWIQLVLGLNIHLENPLTLYQGDWFRAFHVSSLLTSMKERNT